MLLLVVFITAIFGFFLIKEYHGGFVSQFLGTQSSTDLYSANVEELSRLVKLPNENIEVNWVADPDSVVGLSSSGNRNDGQPAMVVGIRRGGTQYIFDIYLHPDYMQTILLSKAGANGFLNSHILDSFLFVQYGENMMDIKREEYCHPETCDLKSLTIIQ